jgi:hypothetical protein
VVEANYFNSLKKCHEPLLEPLRFAVMFEKVCVCVCVRERMRVSVCVCVRMGEG